MTAKHIYTGELKIDGIIIHKAKFVVDLFHLYFKNASENMYVLTIKIHIHTEINTHIPHTHIHTHTHNIRVHIYIFFIQPNFILVASTVLRSAPLFLRHRETNSSNICKNCFRICLTCAIAIIVLFAASAGFHHDYNIYSALFRARLRYQDSTEIHCTKTTASIRTPAIGRSFKLVLFASLRILDHTTSEYILCYIDSLVFYILSRLSFSSSFIFFSEGELAAR